ncbi:MAG: dockerin type I repeat-containing protein [Clostridia bacterium]|nr:dockerin type I repeat-containing protein [Clostridia bacterium]
MKKIITKALCIVLVVGVMLTTAVTAFSVSLGDVNSDGKVNSMDALCILSHSVGSTPATFNKSAADLNNDGKINSIDALTVLQIAVGAVTIPPADTPASSTAEIVSIYNNAVNKMISSKAGFNKTRVTNLHSLDGGALLKIQLVVDMVHHFLGVGTTYWDNHKGQQKYLSNASLTANDIRSASCTNNNGIYTITLYLKNGSSTADKSNSSDTSPLQRSGVFSGNGDFVAYDYKNAETIYTAINSLDNSKADSATEDVTNAVITAVIDSGTGNMQSLTVTWDWYVVLANVKYTVVGIKNAKGNATTTVEITDIQF